MNKNGGAVLDYSYILPHFRYDRALLEQPSLPKETKDYLLEHGLPDLSNTGWLNCIVLYNQEKLCENLSVKGMTVIGELYERHIIAVNKDCQVFLIDNALKSLDSDSLSCDLMHSSVQKFVEFIYIYLSVMKKDGKQIEDGDKQIARHAVDFLESEFMKIDPVALSDDDSFWSVRIEEISYAYM